MLYSFVAIELWFVCWIKDVAGLGNPMPIDVALIYNNARLISLLLSTHFLMEHFTNFMQHPPVHGSNGSRMTLWAVLCSAACKIVWICLIWSLCLHLTLISLKFKLCEDNFTCCSQVITWKTTSVIWMDVSHSVWFHVIELIFSKTEQ